MDGVLQIGMKHKLMVITGLGNDLIKMLIMSKIDFYLLSLLFVFTVPGCKKEFDVFLNNNTKVLNYQTDCGSIELKVEQLRNENFNIYASFQIHKSILFYKDSILVEYNGGVINDVEFFKTHNHKDYKIDSASTLFSNTDELYIGFIISNVNFEINDTIHVDSKGAFYCEGKPIVEIEKINIILKNE